MTNPPDVSRIRAGQEHARSTIIPGDGVVLRPAAIADRRQVFEWLAHSDITSATNGPPIFPEKPIPTWDEFCDADSLPYFTDSAPHLGRCYLIPAIDEAVGQVTYNDIHHHAGRARTELDIWMRSETDCGPGFGTRALLLLCAYLGERFGVEEFMVQPSARNPRAIRAYQKIGFRPLGISVEASRELWGPNDHVDSVHSVLTKSENPALSIPPTTPDPPGLLGDPRRACSGSDPHDRAQ
jgi:RimJ/RimL family protein N-acetyltransferase